MQRCGAATAMVLGFALLFSATLASGQIQSPRPTVTLTVLDEDGLPVSGAQVILSEPGAALSSSKRITPDAVRTRCNRTCPTSLRCKSQASTKV